MWKWQASGEKLRGGMTSSENKTLWGCLVEEFE